MISYSRVALMREQSHAEVYFVYGGAKFWIQNPGALAALGFDWSKVQVVPDGTLAALPAKPLDTTDAVKASDVFFDPGPWSPITPPFQPMMSKDPKNIVRKNVLIAGWLSPSDGPVNCWTSGTPPAPYVTEDYHYELILDADFINQMYGPGGLSTALNGAMLPGNLSGPGSGPPLRFDDISEVDGSSRGVTANSFALPHMAGSLSRSGSRDDVLGYEQPMPNNFVGTGVVFVHVELNCWHANSAAPWFTRPYWGRGPAPAGWVQWAPCNEPSGDAWWPYHPENPDNGPGPLQMGDYVLMKGTLLQEHAHDLDTPSLWRAEPGTLMHCGLMEMHPPYWITRVQAPPIRKTAFMVAACTGPSNPTIPAGVPIFPYPYLQPPPGPAAAFMWRKLVDGRFSHADTFTEQTLVEPGSKTNIPGSLWINLNLHATGHQGRFKAIYETWWQMPLMASILPTSAAVGSRVTLHVHAEDSATHAAVAGTVMAAGKPIGTSGTDFPYVFERLDTPLTLSAQDYADIAIPITLVPGSLNVKTTAITTGRQIPVTVSATNAAGEPVKDGDVYINNAKAGRLGVPFNYTFHSAPVRRILRSPKLLPNGGGGGDGPGIPTESGYVSAPGYNNASIEWNA